MNADLPSAPSTTGWMLAIDTSTEQAGLALGAGSRVLTRSWNAGRAQTTTLLPAIDTLLAEAGITPGDLAAVAVAIGPGTFTGLRVGLSIAKGLVLARGSLIVAVPTLEITAGMHPSGPPLVAVLPAGRGRVVWQRFGPASDDGPVNSTVPELIDALAGMPDVLVAGELVDAHRQMIEAAHAHVEWGERDPAVLLRLARERWQRGEVSDPVTLEPTYLHGVTVSAGPVQDRLNRR